MLPPLSDPEKASGTTRGISSFREVPSHEENILFAIFACTSTFDTALQHQDHDSPFHKTCKPMLESIVQQLRSSKCVGLADITKLHEELAKVRQIDDPDVFIYTFFRSALNMSQFLQYSNNAKEYVHTLHLPETRNSQPPTIQDLLNFSTEFDELPKLKLRPHPALIIKLPRDRDGSSPQGYRTIIPNLRISITNIMDRTESKKCVVCKTPATIFCVSCTNFAACNSCKLDIKVAHLSKFKHTFMESKIIPTEYNLDLISVVCRNGIRFTTLVKCGAEDAWLHFDSTMPSISKITEGSRILRTAESVHEDTTVLSVTMNSNKTFRDIFTDALYYIYAPHLSNETNSIASTAVPQPQQEQTNLSDSLPTRNIAKTTVEKSMNPELNPADSTVTGNGDKQETETPEVSPSSENAKKEEDSSKAIEQNQVNAELVESNQDSYAQTKQENSKVADAQLESSIKTNLDSFGASNTPAMTSTDINGIRETATRSSSKVSEAAVSFSSTNRGGYSGYQNEGVGIYKKIAHEFDPLSQSRHSFRSPSPHINRTTKPSYGWQINSTNSHTTSSSNPNRQAALHTAVPNIREGSQVQVQVQVRTNDKPQPLLPYIEAKHISSVCGAKGIKLLRNSCYLDTALFSFFFCTNVLDDLVYSIREGDQLLTKQLKFDICEIVNLLRSDKFVPGEVVMRLREKLVQEGKFTPKLTGAFMGTYNLPPFIQLSTGASDYLHQIFLPVSQLNGKNVATVQELFEKSMRYNGNLTFLKRPNPALIILLPRSNGKLIGLKYILPSLTLDLTRVMKATRKCIQCENRIATFACSECGPEGIASCERLGCQEEIKRVHRSIPHAPNISRINQPDPNKHKMKLIAVVCVATFHYTTYVRCGDEWLFFDSMVPIITKINNGNGILMTNEQNYNSGSLPKIACHDENMTRVFKDCHYCIYVPVKTLSRTRTNSRQLN